MSADRVVIYKDTAEEWRWHRVAANGNIISESGEGYDNRDWAFHMAVSLNPDAEVFDRDEL